MSDQNEEKPTIFITITNNASEFGTDRISEFEPVFRRALERAFSEMNVDLTVDEGEQYDVKVRQQHRKKARPRKPYSDAKRLAWKVINTTALKLGQIDGEASEMGREHYNQQKRRPVLHS